MFLLLFASVFLASRLRAADAPEEADQPETDALTPETMGRLTLTLETGGHLANIHRVLFTPDGKELITIAVDHTIRFWDVDTGLARRVLRPPGMGGLDRVALSADGQLLAVSTYAPRRDDRKDEDPVPLLCVLRRADGRLVRSLQGHGDIIKALAFSPDGKLLASGDAKGAVRLWDLESGKDRVVVRGGGSHPRAVVDVAFSPDGQRLARVSHSNLGSILDAKTGRELAKLEIEAKHPFLAVAWADDGKTLATFSLHDGVRLWGADGKPGKQVKFPDLVPRTVTFSRALDRFLATGVDAGPGHHAALFDLPGGRELARFSARDRGEVLTGALSPDGKLAATAGGFNGIHETFLWQTADGKQLHHLAGPKWLGTTTTAGWGADGKTVIWGNRSLNLAELKLGPEPVKPATTGPVHKLKPLSLEITDPPQQSVRVLKDSKPFATLAIPVRPHQTLLSATLLGTDRAVLTDNRHCAVWLYDLGPGKADEPRNPVRHLDGHASAPWAVVPSPDNRYLLSVSGDQTLRIWSPTQDKALLALYVQGEDWIVWTPQGGYYAATPGGEKLMGWTLDRGTDEMPAFYPAERFRKLLHRPDLMGAILEKGSVEEALKTNNRGVVEIDDVLPPHVKITEVTKVPNGDKTGLRIKAEASGSKGQAVQSLRLLLDGRPHPDAAPKEVKPGAPAAAEWTIEELPGGRHELKVLARCPDVSGVSEAVPVSTDLADKDKPLLYRVCVGVNDYDQKGLKLGSARQDAEAVFEALEKCCTGKGNRFRTADGVKLLDRDATRDAVLKALKDVRQKKVKPGDLVVVFFAGHGVVQAGEFYLLTREANPANLKGTALSGKDLQDAFADVPCSVLLLMDACHSAAGVPMLRLKPATDDLTRSLADDQVAVTVLAAAMGHETAGERPGHGLFTQALLKGLEAGAGVAFDPYDHQMYVHHLYSLVFSEVRRASEGRQNPFLNMPWTVPPLALRAVPEK
jgi:WD40 repeat protein